MMKWVFTVLILLSIGFGAGTGRIGDVSAAALTECGRALELCLTLAGAMALWSGLMKVAQESGLTDRIARLLSPVTSRLFGGVSGTSRAMQYISMNITANLLGLGNAATPLGLAAMRELEREIPAEQRGTASDAMVTLVVLNTASIQLIPTTVAVLRAKYGAAEPLDIVPAVLLVSLASVTVSLLLTKILNRLFPAAGRRKAGLG